MVVGLEYFTSSHIHPLFISLDAHAKLSTDMILHEDIVSQDSDQLRNSERILLGI